MWANPRISGFARIGVIARGHDKYIRETRSSGVSFRAIIPRVAPGHLDAEPKYENIRFVAVLLYAVCIIGAYARLRLLM